MYGSEEQYNIKAQLCLLLDQLRDILAGGVEGSRLKQKLHVALHGLAEILTQLIRATKLETVRSQ